MPENFQPPDGSRLTWRKYIPDGDGPNHDGKFITILVIHGVGFHGGDKTDAGVEKVCNDLKAWGYLALAVNYRLAPCGRITGQPDHPGHPESGRPPEQTDDIKSLIRAARSLSISNGVIGVIGGSAGGSHTAFVALDKTPSPPNTYPNWSQNGTDDRPGCVVCLSGMYDAADRTDTDKDHGVRVQFIRDIENYTNTVEPDDQRSVSPVAKVKPKTEQSFKPIYLANSQNDPMPPHQIEDMRNALCVAGIGDSDGLKTVTISGSDAHSWNLWNLRIDGSNIKIRDDVHNFLIENLGN